MKKEDFKYCYQKDIKLSRKQREHFKKNTITKTIYTNQLMINGGAIRRFGRNPYYKGE